MKIGIYISELLFDHENVILPGFGMFSTEYIPARFIPEQKKVESPSKIISFTSTMDQGETPLIDHIAMREGTDKEKVGKFIGDFVKQMQESLNAGSKVELENIGVFSKDAAGALLFEPDTTINYLGDASGLSSVKEPGKTGSDRGFVAPVMEKAPNTEQPARGPVYLSEETPPTPGPVSRERDTNGLSPTLRWIAYTVVPLLIIIIIFGFNWRFFFGADGLFRSSKQPTPTEQVITPQPVAPEQSQAEQETPEVSQEVPAQAFDYMAEPAKPEAGRPVYYIVAGSFENHHQAQAFAEDLRKAGASLAGIFMLTPSGYHRVAYGYYYDLQQAQQELIQVQQQVSPNAWILHR